MKKKRITEKQVLKAAKIIKKYCEENLCYDCPLRNAGCGKDMPVYWKLPVET